MLGKAAAMLAALSWLSLTAPAAADEPEDRTKKLKRPALELRATPRFSFSPARILVTAELKGGDEMEELYCPEVEWEWGDGDRSVEESDCEPWTSESKLDRRFTGNHVYQNAGRYRVRVTLRKSGKNVMSQTMDLTVRAGLGDTSPEPGL